MNNNARYLLERIVAWYDDDADAVARFVEEIRAYLAEPEVKPLSNTDTYPFCGVVKMPEGWNTFANQETNTNPSETINSQEVDRSGAKQDEEPKTHEPWCAYLTQMLMSNPPQRSECNCKNNLSSNPEFVRLSEEEVNSLTYAPLEPYELICAVENMLERKNRE